MNIPVEVARSQGHHGIRGGRPRLDLTDKERLERRRLQYEAYRRRRGIPPRVLRPATPRTAFSLAVDAIPFARDSSEWRAAYCDLWDERVSSNQRRVLEGLNSGEIKYRAEEHWFVVGVEDLA